jgi:hypothetical protein
MIWRLGHVENIKTVHRGELFRRGDSGTPIGSAWNRRRKPGKVLDL